MVYFNWLVISNIVEIQKNIYINAISIIVFAHIYKNIYILKKKQGL